MRDSISKFAETMADDIQSALDGRSEYEDLIQVIYAELAENGDRIDHPFLAALDALMDRYVDAVDHGFEFVDFGIPVEQAKSALVEAVLNIRNGKLEGSPLLMKFEFKHYPNKFWPPKDSS